MRPMRILTEQECIKARLIEVMETEFRTLLRKKGRTAFLITWVATEPAQYQANQLLQQTLVDSKCIADISITSAFDSSAATIKFWRHKRSQKLTARH